MGVSGAYDRTCCASTLGHVNCVRAAAGEGLAEAAPVVDPVDARRGGPDRVAHALAVTQHIARDPVCEEATRARSTPRPCPGVGVAQVEAVQIHRTRRADGGSPRSSGISRHRPDAACGTTSGNGVEKNDGRTLTSNDIWGSAAPLILKTVRGALTCTGPAPTTRARAASSPESCRNRGRCVVRSELHGRVCRSFHPVVRMRLLRTSILPE